MKKIICSLILLCSWSLYAQKTDDYRPFIEEVKVWVSAMFLGYRPWSGLNILYDYFDKDTIVADTPCKCWRQRYYNPQKDATNIFTVAAYEEDGKVWFFHAGETTPRLAYDFKANIGDTIVVSSADAQVYNFYTSNPNYGLDYFNRVYQDTILIMGKGSVVLDGCKLDYIRFNSGYFDFKGNSEYHYQRLGSLIRPSFNHSARASSQAHGLLYCTINDEVIYYSQAVIDFWQDTANNRGITLPIPTSIYSPPVLNSKSVNGQCFDLTGRRLAAPPSKGIYIENGRKKVGR